MLTKTFTFSDEEGTKITTTQIKWKEGMGLQNGVNCDKKLRKQATIVWRKFSLAGLVRINRKKTWMN
ncbi:hypothetical protein SLEP1_g43050 [Rubroshorea leprosula]|uniref:Uncharacterized protein n=1 Tax=Rubroshorea leprosula TaxID=152421 RepID=A0AAV5LBT4_9ROSI|nr:hypothetical protein SLEP1_g43050 [Rubroshorea leprosula]